jgi:hypothetical protein
LRIDSHHINDAGHPGLELDGAVQNEPLATPGRGGCADWLDAASPLIRRSVASTPNIAWASDRQFRGNGGACGRFWFGSFLCGSS